MAQRKITTPNTLAHTRSAYDDSDALERLEKAMEESENRQDSEAYQAETYFNQTPQDQQFCTLLKIRTEAEKRYYAAREEWDRTHYSRLIVGTVAAQQAAAAADPLISALKQYKEELYVEWNNAKALFSYFMARFGRQAALENEDSEDA